MNWNKLSGEEKANVLTHLPGIIATIVLAPILIVSSASRGWAMVLGISLFAAGMLMMYTSSTLYHLANSVQRKRRLRVFDHSSIFVMIAGSYSPILIGVLGGWVGWTLFVLMWGFTTGGIISKIVALGKWPKLSLALYLIMGWVALIVIYPLWKELTHMAFFAIIAEGVLYSVGAYFFAKDEEHAYYHAIWHVFILMGSAAHTVALFANL